MLAIVLQNGYTNPAVQRKLLCEVDHSPCEGARELPLSCAAAFCFYIYIILREHIVVKSKM
jgi:hypothetical protein